MNQLEDDLTVAFQDLAAIAPPGVHLAQAARQRSRRLVRRRRVAGAAGLAGVLGLGAIGASALTPGPSRPRDVLGSVTSTSDFLVPAGDLSSRFPLTPSYFPPGIQTTPRLVFSQGQAFVADWELTAPGRDGPLSGLEITVADHPTPSQGPHESTDIDGTPATVTTGTGLVQVAWQRQPKQWVAVTGFNTVASNAEVLRVARSLRDSAIVQPSDLHLRYQPRDFVLLDFNPGGLTLGPQTRAAGSDPSVSVYARRADPQIDGRGEAVRVGDRDGWLEASHGVYDLVLVLSEQVRLEVITSSSTPWNRDELARFAGGVTYAGGVPRAEG